MTMSGDQRFRRSERLRLRRDFARVFTTRCRRADRALVVYVAPNELEWSRLGLSVSKRLGKAVHRNYIKRRIREAFRRQKADLPKGVDIVCVARPEAARADWDLAKSLRTLVTRAVRGLAPDKDGDTPSARPPD
jgi:ribonuclease P protein component